MVEFCEIEGSLTLRDCPEATEGVAKLRFAYPALTVEHDPESGEFSIHGGYAMEWDEFDLLVEAVDTVGLAAEEAEMIFFSVDGEDGVVAVGPTAEGRAERLSQYHIDDISGRLQDLTDVHVRELLEFVHAEHQERINQATRGAAI